MNDDDAYAEGFDELLLEASTQGDWGDLELEEARLNEQLMAVRFTTDTGSRYAIEGSFVREIIGAHDPTSIPGSPPHIRGIIVHRRQVVALLDLDRFLGHSRDSQPFHRIILVESGSFLVGLPAVSVASIEAWRSDPKRDELVVETLQSEVRRYTISVEIGDAGSILLLDIAAILDEAAAR